MSDLRDLYQDVILDHGKRPRNHRRPEYASHEAHGHNPLCGDRLTVYLDVADGRLRDVAFEGSGCAISTASASMMTEALRGKTVAEAEDVFTRVHAMLTGSGPMDAAGLGKLAVFAGVKEFPVRVKCASLAWHTFKAALNEEPRAITTE